jgi:hypothetical protein
MCIIHRNGWHITRVMQPKRRMSHLEPHSYNKSHPSPKAYCFSKSVDKKPLLVSSPYLASLNSACISFTPIKCAPWFESIIEPFLLQASTLHGDGLPFKPCCLSLHATLRTILFELSKETLFLTAIVVAPQASPGILFGTLVTLVSHRGQSDTQDSVVHFYAMAVWPPGDFMYLSYLIIQENVASAHIEESSPFQLSACPSGYTVNAPFIVSCFPPPFINLRTRFLLRAEGYNTPCYGKLNQVN